MSDKRLTIPRFQDFEIQVDGEYEDFQEAFRRWKDCDDEEGKVYVWTIARYLCWINVYAERKFEDERFINQRPDIAADLLLLVMRGLPEKCKLDRGSAYGWMVERVKWRKMDVMRKYFGVDNRENRTWAYHRDVLVGKTADDEWYRDVDEEYSFTVRCTGQHDDT